MPAASWEYHLIASFIRANEQGTGNYLPYIPSFHLSHELAWTHQTKSHILFRLTARHKFVAKQNRFNPATDLIPYTPPAYHLFGAGSQYGVSRKIRKQTNTDCDSRQPPQQGI